VAEVVDAGVEEATPTEITDLSVIAVVTVDQGAAGEVGAMAVPSTVVVVEEEAEEEDTLAGAEDGGKHCHQR